MDAQTRTAAEGHFGHDFSRVRVHHDATAAASARSLGAAAYTVGSDVVFSAGAYAPGTPLGQALIAHELAHVVQHERQGSKGGGRSLLSKPSDAAELESRRAASPEGIRSTPRLTATPAVVSRQIEEAAAGVWDVGPIDALTAKRLADEALAAARGTGLPGVHNGPADAWRHCYWNCTMTGAIGATQAERVATNHERLSRGPPNEGAMDLHNNAEGRACGGTTCDSCCQGKLDSGALRVLDAGGAVVPSTATPRSTAPVTLPPAAGYY